MQKNGVPLVVPMLHIDSEPKREPWQAHAAPLSHPARKLPWFPLPWLGIQYECYLAQARRIPFKAMPQAR